MQHIKPAMVTVWN